MKKLLILGGGTAGTIMANKMRKALPKNEWEITIIEKEANHYYQPGFLFIPFGYYKEEVIKRPTTKFFPAGINFLNTAIDKIDTDGNNVSLKDGQKLVYDLLIIATGSRISPEDTPGLMGNSGIKVFLIFIQLKVRWPLQNILRAGRVETL